MRKNKLFTFLSMFLLFGFLVTGCDDNMPEVKEIGVDSVTLSEELRDGVKMEIGTTMNISWQVTLSPENATDRAESYYSSNVEVATVTAKGILSAHKPGTSEISIVVGGKSAEFLLTVTDKIIIPATSIELVIPDLDMMVGGKYDLSAQLKILPLEANDGVTYTSSAPEVLSVDADGMLNGLSEGTATITVASKSNSNIKATLPVSVTVFSGDYPRANWSLTASQTLFVEGTNSLTSALDGDVSTWFGLVRPGKTYKDVSVPAEGEIYFIIDMKQTQPVNYFRLRHRNDNQLFIRYYKIQEILGSDDGVNFTSIKTDVVITDASNPALDSPDITIPKSSYRYFKFYCKDADCFYTGTGNQGSSAQISEIYLGLK